MANLLGFEKCHLGIIDDMRYIIIWPNITIPVSVTTATTSTMCNLQQQCTV